MESNLRSLAVAGIAVVVAFALLGRDADTVTAEATDLLESNTSAIDRFMPTSADGEIGIDTLTGVVYDDPETGVFNDEPGDDRNASFAEADTDPRTYAPDVEGDTVAPTGGVIADIGDSQNYGSAPEQANDDLNVRTAESNLSDSYKSAFDRLANYDDVTRLEEMSDTDTSTVSDGAYYTGSFGL